MKKRAVIIALIAAVMCMPAAGCQNTDSAANTAEQQVILVQGEALWAESANTFDELYTASDLVMEITVADTEAVYVIDSVETLITPEVVKVWKGDRQGEQLFVFGGDISAQDFKNTASENDRVHLSGYSEEQLAESVVQWRLEDCAVPQTGDHLIFFGSMCTEGENSGRYKSLYTHQGVYFCDDTQIDLEKSLCTGQLREDLLARFPSEDSTENAALSKQAFCNAL